MQKEKILLLILSLIVVSLTSLVTVVFIGKKDVYKPGVSNVTDKAVAQSRKVYREKKVEGVDFSDGPCLSNDLISDWVLDLVHNPRTKVDDIPSNQCSAFAEGRAKHFVEMDLEGKVVRVK